MKIVLIYTLMNKGRPLEELPVLRDIGDKDEFRFLDDLRITAINGHLLKSLPMYYHTEVFVLQFIVRGTLTGDINHRLYKCEAPVGIFLFPNHVLRLVDFSANLRTYLLSFSVRFSKELNLNFGSELRNILYIRPIMPMTEEQLEVCLHYMSLLKEVAVSNSLATSPASSSTAREVAIHLVRSLMCYVVGLYDKTFREQHALSRSEEIAGRFLALVDENSREHHTIDWYAEELRLSPKYVANVVRQVTGRSAGDCITETLIRQAKSMLLTTSFSIQQIADRLGFQNQSHFGTFFRRAVGMSPRKFRNQ